MGEQLEQRQIWLKLSWGEAVAQRWEETVRRDDFGRLAHFGVSDVELFLTFSAAYNSSQYTVQLRAQGRVQMVCDRCAKPFWFPLVFEEMLVIQRGQSVVNDGDEWTIPHDVERVDLMPFVEESLYLELPMRHYHGMPGSRAEECDAEMLSYIDSGEGSVEFGLDDASLAALASLREKMKK